MGTTFSGQDVVADRLCHGGLVSIARMHLAAELTCGPSGDVLRRPARITCPAGPSLRSFGSCENSFWKPPVLRMWSVSDISWAFGCLVTLCTLSLWSWCAPSAGCNTVRVARACCTTEWRFLTNGTSPPAPRSPGFQRRSVNVMGLALLDNWHQ
ncbi:uncharacterized protein LOC144101946 [Amblyomma americanum]